MSDNPQPRRDTQPPSALAELRQMLGQPVSRERADEMDALAQRLGVHFWATVRIVILEPLWGWAEK